MTSRVSRAVNPSIEAEADGYVLFAIEAEDLLEYEMLCEVPDEAICAFADFNSVHNVWPFWRFHVHDVLQRARLPHVDVPFFSRKPDSR